MMNRQSTTYEVPAPKTPAERVLRRWITRVSIVALVSTVAAMALLWTYFLLDNSWLAVGSGTCMGAAGGSMASVVRTLTKRRKVANEW